MSEKITPALSADEWREVLEALAVPVGRGDDGEVDLGARITEEGELEVHDGFSIITGNAGHSPLGRVALINHALPAGDPRKITRELVDGMRQAGECLEAEYAHDRPTWELAQRVQAFADALESYLPPA